MKNLFIVVSLLFVVAFVSCAQPDETPELREKIGQMIMVGFSDTVVFDSSHIVQGIKNHHIGGVILYEYSAITKSRPRNITSKNQLKQLTKKLQGYAKTPLFIGIDEEGGKVSRLKTRYGFEPTVSAGYLGTIDNTDSTRFYADRIAQSCKWVGVNLNFAPVVDVNINPNCPVIGGIKRSFSENPDEVVQHAGIFITEHNQHKVWCSLKHFPGHGSANVDSHLGFTDISETWSEVELEPYKKLIAMDLCPMVMTAHVFNKNIDRDYPATLSKTTLSILRDSLNYNGLILSDDMMMRAIAHHYGLEESIEKAINAGVDMLLFSNNIDTYNRNIAEIFVNTTLKLVQEGKITEERINESYNRVMAYKKKAW